MARFGTIPTELDMAAGQFVRRNAGDTAFEAVSGVVLAAYASMTDGTTTSNASGSDTFKFRSANDRISHVITDNDATHGDNVLVTFHEDRVVHQNLSGAGTNTHAQIDAFIAAGGPALWSRTGTVLSPTTSGDTIKVNAIDEESAGVGVTVDSLLIQDGGIGTASNYQERLYIKGTSHRADGSISDYYAVYSAGATATDNHFSYRFGGTIASPLAAPTDAYIAHVNRSYAHDATDYREIARFSTRIDGSVATDNVAGRMYWLIRGSGVSASLDIKMTLNQSSLAITGADVIMDDSAKLYMDGGTDDYITNETGVWYMYINDIRELRVTATYLDLHRNTGPRLVGENASSTNPTIVPYGSDDDTGLGWSVADHMSLIAGGQEVGLFGNTKIELNAPNGSSSNGSYVQIQAGQPDGAGNDGGPVTIKGGDAILADSLSDYGSIYLMPGNPYQTSSIAFIYVGDSTYNGSAIGIQSTGSATDVDLYLDTKGSGYIQLNTSEIRLWNLRVREYIGDMEIQPWSSSYDLKVLGAHGQTGDVNGKNLTLAGGTGATTGVGGNVYIQRGVSGGGGAGTIYMGTGAAGHLPAVGSETNVVYYDTATGKLSYGPTSGIGVTTFTGLTDTPSVYTGAGGYMLMVNSTPDAVEFVDPSGYAINNFSGTLTANWTITGSDSYRWRVESVHASTGSVYAEITDSGKAFNVVSWSTDSYSGAYGSIYVDDAAINIVLEVSGPSNPKGFYITQASMLVRDDVDATGLQYNADYSTAGAALGDRWIPDKGYVDSVAVTPADDILDWTGTAYAPYSAQTTGAFDSSTTNPISAVNRLNFDGEFYAYNLYAANATDSVTITSGGQVLIYTGGANQLIFQPYVSDGAGAYAYSFDTENTLSTEGAKIATFKSNGTERFVVYGQGQIMISARSTTGLPTPAANYGLLYQDSADDKLYFKTSATTYDLTSGTTAHNLLSATHTDTLAASVVRGDIIVGNSTPAWSRLAISGTSNHVLRTNGTDVYWGALNYTDLTGSAPAGVSFGDTDQIPHMNAGTPGTDFDYSSSFTFSSTNGLYVNYIGIGVAASSSYALRTSHASTAGWFERAFSGTPSAGTPYAAMALQFTTTASNINTGPFFYFKYEDSSAVVQNIAAFGAMRDSADNSGKLMFYTYNAGSRTLRMDIDSTGNYSLWNSADTSERLTIAMNTDNYASIYHFDTTGSVYKYLRLGSNVTTSSLIVDGSNGHVGMGVLPTAAYNLYINDASSDCEVRIGATGTANDVYLRLMPSGTGDDSYIILGTASTGYIKHDGTSTYLDMASNSTTLGLRIDAGGWLYAPNLHNITNTNYVRYNSGTGEMTWLSSSDIRLKENVEVWNPDSLGFLMDLPLIKYDRKDGSSYGEIGWNGTIMRELMPEMTWEDKKGYVQIKDAHMIFHAHGAIKQLGGKVETLEERVSRLEKENVNLRKQLSDINNQNK